MLLKDRLESDTRVLFKVQEAVELTGKSQNWFLDKAEEKEIEFLYRIPTDEVVYCLIPRRENAQFNNQFEGTDLSQNPKTSYLESNDYDYAVLTYLHYESVILEGEAVLRSFTTAAVLDKRKKTLKYTHASSIKDIYKDKPRQLESSSSMMQRYFRNEFRIFKNRTPNNPQKIFGRIVFANRPGGTIDTTIKIDDLWITRESLLSSVGETPLDEYITDYPWPNEELKALNLACINYYNDIFTNSNKTEDLKNFLIAKIDGISDTCLKYCIRVITEGNIVKNIIIPSKEVQIRYPKYFPYCLVNMNEVSRKFYIEHSKNIDNGDRARQITTELVVDKARSSGALPEGMIRTLARFMKPKL